MVLLKFVVRELVFPIFENRFVKSQRFKGYDVARLNVRNSASKPYDKCIVACCITMWNKYVQKFKPTEEANYSEFLLFCTDNLAKERDKMYV